MRHAGIKETFKKWNYFFLTFLAGRTNKVKL